MADKTVCWKCGGSGYLPQYSYFNHGVCYACHGTGYITEQQEYKVSQDGFEKATKKGGDLVHLFDVNPKHLDRKQLEKFRTRIKTRATELGVKLKAGFTTDTALKKVWEAYAEKHPKTSEKMGNRFHKVEPVQPPKTAEPPKIEPPKPSAPTLDEPKPTGTATATATKPKPKFSRAEVEAEINRNPINMTGDEFAMHKKRVTEMHEAIGRKTDGLGLGSLKQNLANHYGIKPNIEPAKPKAQKDTSIPMPPFGFKDISEPKNWTYDKGHTTGYIQHPDEPVTFNDTSQIKSLLEYTKQPIGNFNDVESKRYRGHIERIAMILGLEYDDSKHFIDTSSLRGAIVKELSRIETLSKSPKPKNPEPPKKTYTRDDIEKELGKKIPMLSNAELEEHRKTIDEMHNQVFQGKGSLLSFGQKKTDLKNHIISTTPKESGQSDEDIRKQRELNQYNSVQETLTVKNGKAYNAQGIEIINPISDSQAYYGFGSRVDKKVGTPVLPKPARTEEADLENKYGRNATAKAYRIVEDVFDLVNKVHPKFISNVGLGHIKTDSKELNVGGYYNPGSKDFAVNVGRFAHIYFDAEHNSLTPGQLDSLHKQLRLDLYETVMHELSHAFHAQSLSNYGTMDFYQESYTTSKKANLILDEYAKAVKKLPYPLNNKNFTQKTVRVLLKQATGWTPQEAQLLNDSGFKTFSDLRAAFGNVAPREYSFYNAKEFLATISEKFFTDPDSLKSSFPEYHAMLLKVYEGVVDVAYLKDIQANLDKGQEK
jgi:hypothetical protein